MMQRIRLVTAVFLMLCLAALFAPQSHQAASYTGLARIEGNIQLDLAVSPPVSAPGDLLSLTLSLSNFALTTASPMISLQLPAGLTIDQTALPAGATIDMRSRILNWMPVLPANGGSHAFQLPLRVETVDIANPEQQVAVTLLNDDMKESTAATIWLGIPPNIEAIHVPPQAAMGQWIELRADVVGSGPFELTWYTGDGRRIDVENPSIAYPAAGPYEIIVEASNPLTTVSGKRSVFIGPNPAARFTPDDDTLAVGQTARFINQSGGQTPLTYSWDFGDGTTSTELNPEHQYAAPGIYRVRLTVGNRLTASDAFWDVMVGVPPVVDMEIDESVPMGAPLSGLAFGDESVTRFAWDMGDGRLLEGAQINHTYRQEGNHYVRLIASNDYGDAEVGQWIFVGPGQLATFLPFIMQATETINAEDPFALDLDSVELDEPFVLEPLQLPSTMSQAEQLLVYINEARRQFDLAPLEYTLQLSMAAQQHTNDMALYAYTGHTGSDGSHPLERFVWHGYQSAYAGEATAWGFEYPYQAVEFWVNSPPHRRIILNQQATDVGVAFTVDYNAPNVWYWTAEFGNRAAAAVPPFVRLQPMTLSADAPPMITTPLAYRWNWPLPLQENQQFAVYIEGNGGKMLLGTTTQAAHNTLYSLETAVSDLLLPAGEYNWYVQLEDAAGNALAFTERESIIFADDPDFIWPTPETTPTVTPTPSPVPSATPQATPTTSSINVTPIPTVEPPVIAVTPTPAP